MIERERKFLVSSNDLPASILERFEPGNDHTASETGYFTEKGAAVRVSLRTRGNDKHNIKARVCFKSPAAFEREEFEYEIPVPDAEKLLKLSPTRLNKVRVVVDGWEIDRITVNASDTPGKPIWTDIWVAEWEEHDGKAPFPDELPEWILGEVTGNYNYSNQALAWKYGQKVFENNATSEEFGITK